MFLVLDQEKNVVVLSSGHEEAVVFRIKLSFKAECYCLEIGLNFA